jgi:hypothetical protein
MAYLNGVAAAGNAEATRVAQTVIQRGAEAGVAAINGQREDRANAERVPETGAGAHIGEHAREKRREHERGRRRQRDGGADDDGGPHDPTSGFLVDLQA